jgi:hypothetical protein
MARTRAAQVKDRLNLALVDQIDHIVAISAKNLRHLLNREKITCG